MSSFKSPAYPVHTLADRKVRDQVRPSSPITCDDCARPWQPGAVFWRRASRPAWLYCRPCKSIQDTGQGDWQAIPADDMAEMAQAGHEAATAPPERLGSHYQCGAISQAADRVLRETGQQGGFNHISAAQRAKADSHIKQEQRERSQKMGKMSEQARKNISEGIRKTRAARAAALAAGQGNGTTTVTTTQEVEP